jgi:AraC-like DNA-binding protein
VLDTHRVLLAIRTNRLTACLLIVEYLRCILARGEHRHSSGTEEKLDFGGRSRRIRLMPVQFTTEGAPNHKRLMLWQDIVCDVFVQLDCKSDMGTTFNGRVTHAKLGATLFSDVSSCQQHVYRTPSRIARAREEIVLVALGRHGAGAVLQDGRETTIHPGEFAIYDTTRPYELRFNSDFTQTIFQIPRDMLHRKIADLESLTAIKFTSGRPLEKLAYDFVAAISQIADQVDQEAGARLSEQALDLIAMAMNERRGSNALSSSTHRSALRFRLKSYIQSHLHDPELSLVRAAAALGISTRYVNDLLSDDRTSFQRYVLLRRLEQCERELSSPRHAHRHVGEIAFGWGFNELSHFGRVFREQYGVSPRDWRQAKLPS